MLQGKRAGKSAAMRLRLCGVAALCYYPNRRNAVKPPRIDSHHHFWRYDPIEYGWIDDAMKVIRRDFLPDSLRPEIASVGIDGVISVQARQTIAETAWLLDLATENAFIRGVVGWAPLTDPKIAGVLETFAANPKL